MPATPTLVQRWLHRLPEPPVLFSAIAVLVLAVIWSTTLYLAANEHAAGQRAAAALTADLTDTYEAQMVGALNVIDQTLLQVRYNLRTAPAHAVLREMGASGLLPHEFLFTVSIADADGEIIATTQPAAMESVAARDFFQRTREDRGMVIGLPRFHPETDEWRLHFSRRLEAADGGFGGSVMVSVHAGYFVSGYDPDALGKHGMLGLVGTDGIFRVRRTDDVVYAGDAIEYRSLVPDRAIDTASDAIEVKVNGWDGVRRYTTARKLFEFPLAIVVGLSDTEQLAQAKALVRTYLGRAAAASALLVALIALIGRLSWQLQKARARVAEEQVAYAKRLEYFAYHDSLTDLPNRAFFSRLLVQGMHQARRYERCLALLFLDLDRFKTINDTLGHKAGDELLQEVGRRLRGCIRDSDVIARLGGDEFVILLPEIAHATQAVPVTRKILAEVGKPYTLVGHEYRITVSIGISLFPNDGEDEQTLMKNADIAMYHAKEKGKNNFQFYSEQLSTDALEHLALESSLRNALQNDEFLLYYQAKLDLNSERITGMEALLHWQHPDLGLVAPMKFIPLAEETGLIVPIGRWVLETACRQNVAWQKAGFPALTMAVNLSARQFLDDHLLGDIAGVLRETGVEPCRLELEINERILIRNMERTLQILQGLKQMGVRLAIDDFGMGYTALSTLKPFAFDTIKIDGSFIQEVMRSAEGKRQTEALITLGRSLGQTVIAECVETVEQADFLRTHACDGIQGFHVHEPMPAAECAQRLHEQLLAAVAPRP